MIVLPMIILLAVGCYPLFILALGIIACVRRSKGAVFTFIGFLILPFLLMFIGWLGKPTKPDRSDIIGHYVIDRSKFPGKNADWQNETYTLEITETQAIVRDARTKTVWRYKIEWSDIYDYRWGFADSFKRHHMIANGPTLYRGRFSHHYVFQSPLYGNVFFEKD